MAMPHFARCLLAILRKNVLLKKREWRSTLLELLLPVALMGLIIWFRVEVTTKDIPAQSYVNSPENNPTWFGEEALNASLLGNLSQFCDGDEPTGLCPEIYVQATWRLRKEHYLGVALDGLLPLHMQLYKQQLGVVGSQELASWIGAIPGYQGLVRHFDSDDALWHYVSNSAYGFNSDSPQLFGVIDVRSEARKDSATGQWQGDWDVVIHLNATGPGSVDVLGATDINTKLIAEVNDWQKALNMQNSKIFWSGGLFTSGGMPASTGGFVDLQTLVFSWIYSSSGAYQLPQPETLPKCECHNVRTHDMTQDLSQCSESEVLLKLLTPHWSTVGLSRVATLPLGVGCLGRLSALFPVSMREVPFPTPAYTQDTFADVISGVFGLFFTLVYLWPLKRILKSWMEDKEMRINEVMKMMGMPDEGITWGWYVTYSFLWLIPALLIPAICWTTVFEHSDKVLVFLFFWLFGVCVLSFCSLLVVFFEKARTASVVGALAMFLLYFPYVFVATSSPSSKLLACLCPPVALSFGAALLAQLESAGDGLQWGNLSEESNGINMGQVFAMMLVDTVLFAGLAWYLDKVLVIGFGTRQPWYFLCSKRYWKPVPAARERLDLERLPNPMGATFDDSAPENPRYEPVATEMAEQRSVLIRDLHKQFKAPDGRTLTAVQGITLNLYSGQIFCLLGHNGAGKTTTINMLSGMLPVDGGDATVYGMSVRHDMKSIRKILGVCPQHDVIWSNLTVWEHLRFFSDVKGVDPPNVRQEIEGIIADVGLEEKSSALASTLSGGQKRRLSAAIALIGGSRIVFLDEPSSGVDPFSRRELWECLKRKKTERTIIMTTHFMDEAEELGDRIAIMAAGQVKCVGSSLFLKAQYGVGYTVTISKRPEATAGAIKSLRSALREACPNAQELSDAAGELVYRMPMEDSKAFPSLFKKLEDNPEQYGMVYFSVSVTTLEEVFLRVGQDHTEADRDAQAQVEHRSFVRQISNNSNGGAGHSSNSHGAVGVGAAAPSASQRRVESAGAPPSLALAGPVDRRAPLTGPDPEAGEGGRDNYSGTAIFAKHVYALLVKRYHNAKRDRKAWCCQIAVPLCFLFFALASLKFGGVGEYPATPLVLSALPGHQEVLYGASPGVNTDSLHRFFSAGLGPDATAVPLPNSTSPEEFDNALQEGYYRGGGKGRFGAFRFQSVPTWRPADTTGTRRLAVAEHSAAAETLAAAGWQVANSSRPGVVEAAPLGLGSLLFPEGFTVPVGTLWEETDRLGFAGQGPEIQVPMSDLNNRIQVDLFWNSTARDALPIYYAQLHNQVLRASLGEDALGESSVKFSNQPFPLTAAQKSLTDTQTSLFLALGFAFIPASYGAFVVLERENNSKHLQVISGVNFVAYWVATWLWDIINYLIPAALSVLMIAAFGIESMTSGINLFWTCLIVLMYGISCTSFTYMLTFLFKSHTSAQNLLLIIYLFTGGILEIVAIVLNVIPSTKDLMRNVLVYLFRLLPNYCLADGLTNLMIRKTPLLTQQLGCPLSGCDASNLHIAGYDLLYMGVGSLVWFAFTLLLELAFATPKLRALFEFSNPEAHVSPPVGDAELDADVRAEKERVRSGGADNDVVVLNGLRKVFPGRVGLPPKVAVEDMHFGIPAGQCFGYLGMNGAGKTTTMKMLTGEELSSSGEATLGGFDIKTQQNQVRQLLGYCPQFDALIGTLTAREHLMLYARIKALPPASIPSFVDRLLDDLTLTPYADRQACTFSGGTKRKLSLGIALIGNPRIVFLDEPTTGVDPESRRFMWRLISTTMAGRSVILTTHSMEECEALCSRIGIMVNGRLVCIGSASHLKAIHGSGLQFDVAFRTGCDLKEAVRRLTEFLQRRFRDGARLSEGDEGKQRVQFKLPKGCLPISSIFKEVEDNRSELQLAEYSISETTLDQIFIGFAKHQYGEEVQVLPP